MSQQNTARVAEVAEAICGALHRMSFDFIGESGGGSSTWFVRGYKPKDIRVEVVRSVLAPMCLVNVEFRNLTMPQEKRLGRITCQVSTNGNEADVFMATEKCVLRILEIYKNVLEGTGVAGPFPEVVQSTDSSNVPETEDEERQEFGD